jgi:hypothetical protein
MKNRVVFPIMFLFVGLVAAVLFVSSGVSPSVAQEQSPPLSDNVYPDAPGEGAADPVRNEEGLWVMPAGAQPSPQAPAETGGPDDYGYTWDDSVPLIWIDATTGTDTGMSGYSNQAVGPIALPFSFPYYENSYSSLYIAGSGYIGFTANSNWPTQLPIPSAQEPNNIIAPHAGPLQLATSGPIGRVYYKSGGTAPNRYFVIEWNRVSYLGGEFTFEVILYENGGVQFQYLGMEYGGYSPCVSSGIEDMFGLDGLSYLDFCSGHAPSQKAVRFFRPPPSARVSLYPGYRGQFTHASELAELEVLVRNTGNLGTDTYDLTTASTWATSFFAADGITPLTDTDSDGVVDTGAIAQGNALNITVKVQTPAGATVGNANTAVITARSSINTARSKTITFETAVPAPFVQVFLDQADMQMEFVQPAAQASKKITDDYHIGGGLAVAETPAGGFVYAWSRYRYSIPLNNSVSEIEYALVNGFGETVRGPLRLTNHSNATVLTYDQEPAVAVAPNGRTGLLWRRYLRNSAGQYNFNIYFAILDSAGNTVYGPANVTNNMVWDYGDLLFNQARIAATADNRFVLAWYRGYQDGASYLDDIFYTVRDGNGGAVTANVNLTNDTGDDVRFTDPVLASVANNRAFLSWFRGASGNEDVHFAVIASSGAIVKPATDLSIDETVIDWHNYDAVELANGKIIAVWEAWGCFSGEWTSRIRYVLLDSNYNRIGTPACLGQALSATNGDTDASVTASPSGSAIITYTDRDSFLRRYLYYALVGNGGGVVTEPMGFLESQVIGGSIWTSSQGYGNTTYSWTPPADVDGVASFEATWYGGLPGGGAAVSVNYANHGAKTATNVVLTANLDSELTYLGDTSGVTPVISGNTVTWNLPNMAFLDNQRFVLYLGIPAGAAIGTSYSLTIAFSSDGPEANPSNNTSSTEVVASHQLFLPGVFRD